MMRKFALSVTACALVAVLFAMGCAGDTSKNPKLGDLTEKAKQTADAAKEEASKKAKELVVKPIEELLPQIKEKIGKLDGDALTKGKEKLADFLKLLEGFKTAAPDKWESLKDELLKKFEELKKMAGM